MAQRETAAEEGLDPTAKAEEPREIAGRSPMQIALGRLRHDRVAVVCTVVIVLLVLAGIFAPLITHLWKIYPTIDTRPYEASDFLEFGGPNNGLPTIGPPLHGFTWAHPLGLAPKTAVDNLANLLYGLRTSLFVSFSATVLSTLIGVVLGLIAGFSRGWVDSVLTFVTDLFLSFPFILGALTLAPILISRFSASDLQGLARAQFFSLIGILVAFGWMSLTRLIRGQVLSLREREFVQAAQVIGVPTRRILFRELLPNLLAPIIVSISLQLPAFVAAEAGLSFLGLGLTGRPSLGQTLASAQSFFRTDPLYLYAPVVTIVILVLALNLLGDSIRDAFDPKTRR